MSKKRHTATEKRRVAIEDVRSCYWRHDKTVILHDGEIDIFLPEDDSLKIDIRVGLIADRTKKSNCLDYTRIGLFNADPSTAGADGVIPPLIVISEDRHLDAEMTEVLAFEMIEYLDIAMTYTYGREPTKHHDGRLAQPGEIVHSRKSVEMQGVSI